VIGDWSAVTHEDDGVTAMEYALIVALIAVVLVLAVTLAGNTLRDFFCWSADWIEWTSDRNFANRPVLGDSDRCITD
jgi:Flp pilus assembly pilin Flp